jgi:hypothetical protein
MIRPQRNSLTSLSPSACIQGDGPGEGSSHFFCRVRLFSQPWHGRLARVFSAQCPWARRPCHKAAIFLFVLAAACAKIPFQEESLPPLKIGPSAAQEQISRPLPDRFTSDDTIIIQAPFHDDLAFLAVLAIDRSAGTFELVALNHMGIKLFHVKGNRSNVSLEFVLPPLASLRNILISIGHDIAKMYLDVTPAADSKIKIHSNEVDFIDKHSGQTVVYEFGGDPLRLIDKHHNSLFNSWRVRYYRYSTDPAGLYPRGIVMDNGHYHYRIIVKNRDVEIDR